MEYPFTVHRICRSRITPAMITVVFLIAFFAGSMHAIENMVIDKERTSVPWVMFICSFLVAFLIGFFITMGRIFVYCQQ